MSASKWEFYIDMLGKFYLLQEHLAHPFYPERAGRMRCGVLNEAGNAGLYQLLTVNMG